VEEWSADWWSALAFGARRADDSHRARLRFEVGRLRTVLRTLADVRATKQGFALAPRPNATSSCWRSPLKLTRSLHGARLSGTMKLPLILHHAHRQAGHVRKRSPVPGMAEGAPFALGSCIGRHTTINWRDGRCISTPDRNWLVTLDMPLAEGSVANGWVVENRAGLCPGHAVAHCATPICFM
jgi:hypothetical protein